VGVLRFSRTDGVLVPEALSVPWNIWSSYSCFSLSLLRAASISSRCLSIPRTYTTGSPDASSRGCDSDGVPYLRTSELSGYDTECLYATVGARYADAERGLREK
jgi:hypothetical protein